MLFKLGPISFQVNLTKNIYNKYHSYNMEIEKNLYKTKYKTLLNVGGGNFKHPKWQILDFYSTTNNKKNKIDVLYDLNSLKKIPIEDDSVSIIYSSHTIEHLFKENLDFIISEFYRILDKNHGCLRFVYPDINICFEAYKREDYDFFYLASELKTIEEKFLKIFAMNAIDSESGCYLDNGQIKKILSTKDKISALNSIEQINNSNKSFFRPDYHRSWWNHEILNDILLKNGFNNVKKSAYGQSEVPILRNTIYFDSTHPKYSGYTEAFIKV